MLPPKEFLRKIKPFNLLKEEELEKIVGELEVEAYEEGEEIIKRGENSNYVYFVYSGVVGVYENGELIDRFSRGEIFGLTHNPQRVAVAEEDTICYLIKKDVFMDIMEKNKLFSDFFKSFEEKRFSRIPDLFREEEITDRLFLTRVGELISKKPVVCSPYTSIRDAAIKMELNGVGSIVVVDDNLKPLGILTSKDFRTFIIYGKSHQEKVSAYMTSPVVAVDYSTPVFEAHLELLKRGINHLVVTENGKVRGVITANDILTLFEPTTSLIVLYRKLKKAKSLEEIKNTFKNLTKSISSLVMRGMHFYDLSNILTEIYDYLVVKVIEMEKERFEREWGKLPSFAWVHMGSSARKEQVIATDQDNAIVHEGDGEGLSQFAESVNNALDYVGIPKCRGGYMAMNWCKSVEEWKSVFSEWFIKLTPDNLRFLSVFLDLRVIYGDEKLCKELIEHIKREHTSQSLRYLAYDATIAEPPLGLFGLRMKKEIDLKMNGIYPIVNGVRVLALEHGLIEVTNTRERLEELKETHVMDADLAESLKETYEFLQDLRLRLQAKEVVEGKKADNVIKVSEIDRIEAFVLKEGFKVIKKFQNFLKGHYSIERGL
ncbi:MAG: hypothetical protein XD40_1663 [Archaeoglobus fulgidus]|uniref:Cyclic nucleotide-binding/CBS domain-containing protein n=1 Tax=Archaeoglobus fulgidus TaxID=2234 RepID=A0A101E1A7_ARCFL|nr:putative nucleotidyltransferase substrate binding domain-containing protein [Archaeoglobus fulgidus]KUJ93152.1 MAG: hypothetical protein XD40_1663 [Archaeoglobus fulgidus]KUK06796.1 MAG: hypothetical protein XD48_0959 [Archaeoglobus fulgidus]